ncbi:MAG: radical SAM protein [Lachnospiraceae bacterium]|nr:radical SAM protein [Lachnospiraceae bacterium]
MAQIYDTAQLNEFLEQHMSDCSLCPRNCHINRFETTGYCGASAAIKAACAALHMWEEPCISGASGSGAVFFSGCNVRCVFCQNYNIAAGNTGKEISTDRLAEIFLELQEQNANNINLVTPTHYIPQIAIALTKSRNQGLSLPIVYNTSGYEKVSSLALLEGLIDIYLPDCKYVSSELSTKYSHCHDYFEQTANALQEMFRQTGKPVIDSNTGLLKRGMIVRHLILPGQTEDSKKVISYLYHTFGDDIYISIMNQYTPLPQVSSYPELSRKLTTYEYDKVINFACDLGIHNGFMQKGSAAAESFIPAFDITGI